MYFLNKFTTHHKLNMSKFCSTFVILATLSAILAKPAKEALDKATIKDVIINSVGPEAKITLITDENPNNITDIAEDDFQTSVSFGTPTTHVIKPGPAFARIIDDIFQIPIGVLQSVARLLRNPFIAKKTPEHEKSY